MTPGCYQRYGKRLLDVLLAAVGLAVLWPFLALIAVLIRLESGSPVLFRQTRVGRGGREFTMLKFRTMTTDRARESAQFNAGDASRVTRLGRILRASKLDELPELINLIAGDMSVVGPRPEVPRYVRRYDPAMKRLVLSVRPGLTDWASIKYRDEEELLRESPDPERTYVEKILPDKLALASEYVRRVSLVEDVRIIARTLAVVAFPEKRPTGR